MKKPTIKINGKTYEMKEPKARAWRLITEFEENKKEISNAEYIDKHAEIIAQFFDLSVDEILDGMDISDVIKTFYDCYKYISTLLYSKMEKLGNVGSGEMTKSN